MTSASLQNLSLHSTIHSPAPDSSDYVPHPYALKKEQMEQVLDVLDSVGFIPEQLIELETRWFYSCLGIDDTFFANESPEGIASHIHALYACKVQAFAQGLPSEGSPLIQYARSTPDHAVYVDSAVPGSTQHARFEEKIDDMYIDKSILAEALWRAEYYESPLDYALDPILSGIAARDGADSFKGQLVRCTFVYKNKFPNKVDASELDVRKIADPTFLNIASPNTISVYQDVLNDIANTMGPVIRHMAAPDSYRVVIGYRQTQLARYVLALSDLARYYKLLVTRKYVEQFANGLTIISMYVTSPSPEMSGSLDLLIHQVIKEASLLFCIPHNLFHHRFVAQELSLQESIYAQCGVVFVTHFLNRLGPEYSKLAALLDSAKHTQHAEVLSSLKKRLRAETYTQTFIQNVFDLRRLIVRKLYRSFADVHYIRSSMEKTLLYQRLSQITPVGSEEEFEKLLDRECAQNEHDAIVLRALFMFNKLVLKTNFYTPTKVAISFRLDPTFLPAEEYPEIPYGMFFVVGSDFRGFHIRFRDIARGGIRIVRSRSLDAYNVNARNLFDENYNLANTQQRKNKDIPEGGSKGVILLDNGAAQERPQACFEKYIDSLIDLLLKQHIPGVKEQLVDLYDKHEILFLGPDEGTAGYTAWATKHARARGAPWWRSFLTGKPPQMGGIPHDEYGMTTLSVRAYTNNIYKKLGLTETTIRKVQTGGPDGDLGSNEILQSTPNESYIALVDGSGVLADPQGLDKAELVRLAHARQTVDKYDSTKLSSQGYYILVDDVDFTLPSGELVGSGVGFRNTFHVQLLKQFGPDGLDLFVPCGGRPAAIDTNNVHLLIDEKTGKPAIKFLVEGANLFVTQAAKLVLEKAGVVVFKDASTNKGGVTSSSLEVLAALAFDDAGFLNHMCVDASGVKPQFYQAYVKEVQKTIVRNADNEFEALWKLHADTGITRTELLDKLSVAINRLADELANSVELWNDDAKFRNAVLFDALPPLLLKEIGIENILSRVPVAYLRALFATHLGSLFVYSRGLDANPARFLEFISSQRKSFVQRGLL